LTVARICELCKLSRASYYRQWPVSAPRREEAALRDVLQRLALAHRRHGYRRLTVLLRREGFAVNHKRVLRLMGEDNLLCLRHRPFVPTTTQSDHDWLNPLLPFESRLRGYGRCRRSDLFFSPTFRLQRAAAA
jgi:putative transposase